MGFLEVWGSELKMSWRILRLLHRKNMRFLTFCNNLLKEKKICKAIWEATRLLPDWVLEVVAVSEEIEN